MILSGLFSQFKKSKFEEWEKQVRGEFSLIEDQLRAEFISRKNDLESKVNEVLKEKTDLIKKIEEIYLEKSKITSEFEAFKKNYLKQFDKLKEDYENEIQSLNEETLKEKNKLDSAINSINHQEEIVKFKQIEIENLNKTLNDKKETLLRANEDLRTQLRLIEAKAKPDNVWIEAFSSGFSKAFDTMQHLQLKAMEHMESSIKTKAINETLERLNNGNLPKTR